MRRFLVLDIGCGTRKYNTTDFDCFPNMTPGSAYKVIGIDQSKSPGVDMVVNLESGKLPFPKNMFDGIHCSHVLEHVENFFDLISEIHRVGKPGAVVMVRSPYFSSYRAFTDPEHKRFFTSRTFEYFARGMQLSDPKRYSKSEFRIKSVKIHFGDPITNFLVNLSDFTKKAYERFLPWIFPAIEIKFNLEVIK